MSDPKRGRPSVVYVGPVEDRGVVRVLEPWTGGGRGSDRRRRARRAPRGGRRRQPADPARRRRPRPPAGHPRATPHSPVRPLHGLPQRVPGERGDPGGRHRLRARRRGSPRRPGGACRRRPGRGGTASVRVGRTCRRWNRDPRRRHWRTALPRHLGVCQGAGDGRGARRHHAVGPLARRQPAGVRQCGLRVRAPRGPRGPPTRRARRRTARALGRRGARGALHRAPRETDARAVVEALRERYDGVDLRAYRQRERPGRTRGEFVAALEEKLTGRQLTALRKAYVGGFFDWPHGTSGDELAESMGISRSTFHQHLRAAQRKLVEEFYER